VTSGCSKEKPVCDGEADGGLGACKPIEIVDLYTEPNPDPAHQSYIMDAMNAWLPSVAVESGFTVETTSDWERIKTIVPAPGRILWFLDDKPKEASQQAAFQAYMEAGGAWMGCHFFAYTPNADDWPWFFREFLASGDYGDNTWRPTSAQLKVEDMAHPVTSGLGSLFTAAPNEWYRFEVDLRTVPAIQILVSIDPSSFPLGTGPKPEEIWHEGYYPVVWTNTNYRMLYINMGHDDMEYGVTNTSLSSTFSEPTQNQMLLNAIRWLGVGTGIGTP
jgi:hypothetical protein